MSDNTQMAGKVVTLWRYPIKSMMGEELNATDVTTQGLLGDRAYALIDQATTKVARHNQVNVGVYASVLAGGTIRRGDAIRVQER